MKSPFSKNFFSLFFIPVLLMAFTVKADRANFTGQWKLNESKSELGQFGRFATRVIKAEQSDLNMTIAKTSPSFNGEDVTVSETLSYDGKETETTVFGNSKRKSTAKWSEDGKTFMISYTVLLDFNGQTSEIKGTENWSLSEDGKVLTLRVNASSPQGEFSTTAVYDKQ